MKKKHVENYKIKKGLGQIAFDLALTGTMSVLKIKFDGRGMMIYGTLKGLAYLAWDIYMFNREVTEEDSNE